MCEGDVVLSVTGKRTGTVSVHAVIFVETLEFVHVDNKNTCLKLRYIPPSLSVDESATSVESFAFLGLSRFKRVAHVTHVSVPIFVILGEQ